MQKIFFNKKTFVFITLILIQGCGKKSDLEIQKDTQKKVSAILTTGNQVSSPAAWEATEEHPSFIIKDIEEDNSKAKAYCKTFENLSAGELSVFYDELENSEKMELLPCKDDIKKRMQKFILTSQELLENENLDSPLMNYESSNIRKELPYVSSPHYSKAFLGEGEINITFDDGPSAKNTPILLQELRQNDVHATFYLVGKMMESQPQIVRDIQADGHNLGSHSWSHPCTPKVGCLTALSPAKAEQEIFKAHDLLESITGEKSYFFRFPGGDANERLKNLLHQKGIATFHWNMDTNDWRPENRDPVKLFRIVKDLLNTHKGGVLLLHDIHSTTVAMVPKLLTELRERNFKTVTFYPPKKVPDMDKSQQ